MSPSGLIPKGKVNVEPGGSIVVKVNASVLSSARVNPATTQSATKHVINLHILLFLLNQCCLRVTCPKHRSASLAGCGTRHGSSDIPSRLCQGCSLGRSRRRR